VIKVCVIGWPISHSRSPLIHGYWLKQHRIDGSYTRQPVEPSALNAFLASLSDAGYAGCNVTIPHKEIHLPSRDSLPMRRPSVWAPSTPCFLREGKVFGTNTDGEGFINSLYQSTPRLSLRNSRAVVIGAGGASLAVVNAILEQGASEVAVANRTVEKAHALRQRFGSHVVPVDWERMADQLSECSLLVNTTSLGMKGQPGIELDFSRLSESAVVSDIVYTPLRTKLLEDAARRGNTVVEGLGMLLHQAVRGFSLWFGVTPEVTPELHTLVARDIDPDYRP
jgi:shikimate dehydrogenase